MKSNCEVMQMAQALREMAGQMLTQESNGKRFFADVAQELTELRHKLDCRQEAEAKAHALFHEPLEHAPEIDWATTHNPADGPDHDEPVNFVRVLRKHLVEARARIKQQIELHRLTLELLRKLEWSGADLTCPQCGLFQKHGQTCKLAHVINRLRMVERAGL